MIMSQTQAIIVDNVSKKFQTSLLKPLLALNQVSFLVPRGEVFGFLGPNGAGKTTLIKIIVGILKADHGKCFIVDSQGIPIESFKRKAKLKLGYLPERPYFHDFLTTTEFLLFHGRLMGLPDDEIYAKIPGLLEKVGLSASRHQKLRTFSKGMLQRIGFAQTLLHDPDVLVLDEPMSGLDPVGRREIRDIITQISQTGKTIFFSTHIIHDVEVICTTVGFVQNGSLKGAGNIEFLLGKTLKSMEVRYSLPEKMGPILSPLLSASRKTMDGWALDIESTPDELEKKINEILSLILQQKGIIKSVSPRKSTLEDIFFEGSKASLSGVQK